MAAIVLMGDDASLPGAIIYLPGLFTHLFIFCLLEVYWQAFSFPRRRSNHDSLSSLETMKTSYIPAAAAKSLQSCPTLCDPIDVSPPGSPAPGILQARTLEWVAIKNDLRHGFSTPDVVLTTEWHSSVQYHR